MTGISVWFTLVANAANAAGGHGGGLGAEISPVWVIPFAGMLLSIAVLPMIAHHWWEEHRNQFLVSALWSAPILGYFGYLIVTGHHSHDAAHGLSHAIEEYISFIALLGSLFIISGGVLLKGDLEGKPIINTGFLAVGALIANLIGTTGASMLLIRPMLKTNSEREYVKHIPLFFIFLVSNIGGALTPIGDPPLFLGYLRGVDFFWTMHKLWAPWLAVVVVLLIMFFVVDSYFYSKEDKASIARDKSEIEPLSMQGGWNFMLLAGVVVAVLLLSPDKENPDFRQYYAREIAMFALAGLSMWRTSSKLREENGFTFGPILEVAALFCGIFITMIPATLLLQTHGAALGLDQPWQYFWATGLLSSFLDNAPTYVTFAALACGSLPAECLGPEQLGTLANGASGGPLLVAISLGAVFMGANSYIGNGPNFMVRAIAEENGYKMPSFFGYIGWAAIVLIPVFAVVTAIFLV
jgi:Na+/H+ antiporter NhaD/arsenite permease-like protein